MKEYTGSSNDKHKHYDNSWLKVLTTHKWHKHKHKHKGIMVPQNGPLFQKIRFCHFQTDIIQTSPLQKNSGKKRLFLCKVMDEKRLGH